MIIIRCADKTVIGDIHQFPEILDPLGTFYNIIHKLLRCDLCFFCLLLNLLSVLIGSGQKHDIITAHTFISRDRIRRHRAVSMSDMQFVGRVINWGCNIEFTLAHVSSSIYLSICFCSVISHQPCGNDRCFSLPHCWRPADWRCCIHCGRWSLYNRSLPRDCWDQRSSTYHWS